MVAGTRNPKVMAAAKPAQPKQQPFARLVAGAAKTAETMMMVKSFLRIARSFRQIQFQVNDTMERAGNTSPGISPSPLGFRMRSRPIFPFSHPERLSENRGLERG